MQIDCYGFEATSQWFKRRTLDPYLIKRSEGITYLCFGNQLNRPSRPLAGRRVAAVLPSVEGSLRKRFRIPKRFLRRIPASTATRTEAFASRGRSDAGPTQNSSATFP